MVAEFILECYGWSIDTRGLVCDIPCIIYSVGKFYPKDTVDPVLPKDTVNPVQPKDSLSQELPKDSLGNDEIKDEVAVAKFDIALSIEDIIVDWYGGGGEKDPDNNSFTYKQYANNYWDIHDLNTDVYTKVEINFAKAVAYDNIDVIATYSDEAKTTERIPSGATSLVLSFEPAEIREDKKIIKLNTTCTKQDGTVVITGMATVKFNG